MLKTIAIDDEPLALEVIKNLTSKISFIDLSGLFTDAFKAIDFLQNEKIDLIFLDFIRIHRSYIVSKKHIWKMDKKSIWIKQTEIPKGSVYSKIIEKLSK